MGQSAYLNFDRSHIQIARVSTGPILQAVPWLEATVLHDV